MIQELFLIHTRRITLIQNLVIVTVAYTDRIGVIHIISARKATPQERKTYYEYLNQTT